MLYLTWLLLSKPNTSILQFDIAYNVPMYSSSPTAVLQVVFTPISMPDVLVSASQGPLSSLSGSGTALPSHYSHTGSATIPSDISNPIRDFLKQYVTEPKRVRFVALPKPLSTSCRITLQRRLGEGRTGTVWEANIDDGNPARRVVKMISARHIASAVRESLFYENVFQSSGLARSVPKYYGTYASYHGGWFAIVLEDVGKPVENVYNADWFRKDDELLIR